MYKILIRKADYPKNTFSIYQKVTVTTDDETGKTVKTYENWEADNLEELQAKYEELLEDYTVGQLMAIDDLNVALNIKITDETEE